MKEHKNESEEFFFDPTDDLDGSEVIYDDGTPVPDHPSVETYEPEDFISAPAYGARASEDGTVIITTKDATNNNPWISASVILFCLGFPAFLFWLFLK